MEDYYSDFKPIRNKIKRYNFFHIIDGIVSLRLNGTGKIVPEVEEVLYINSIVHSPYYEVLRGNNKQKEWNMILLGLSDLNTKVDMVLMDEDVWKWTHKSCLNQLKSHSNNYLTHIYRYYYIFSNAKIATHIEKSLNISYKDFSLCAMWIHSVFDKKHYCFNKSYFLESRFDDTPFNIENMSKTLEILSIPLNELRHVLKEQLKYNRNMFLTHGYKHIEKPIFEFEDKLYCIFPNQLLNQITSGLYYITEMFKPKFNLSNEFGSSFEDYVGIVLNKSNSLYDNKVIREIMYNRRQNKTSDWIIETETEIVFIECKTKRLQMDSKNHESISEKDIISISDAVTQVYKVYLDYCDSKIPGLEYNEKKVFIPIVVTLEEWFAGVSSINNEVTKIVKDNLIKRGIDDTWVDNFKFHIHSISEFQFDVQRMMEFGFKEYYNPLVDENNNREDFSYNNYFSEELNELFFNPLEDMKNHIVNV